MKKLTALLLAVTLLLGILPLYALSAVAATNTCGGEGNENNVTWSFDSATGTLTISGTGTMANWYHEMDLSIAGSFGYDVNDYLPSGMEYVYTPWYSLRAKILHAVVSDGITTLGDFTFSGCTNLKDVKLGKDLTVIGHAAFENCESLATIDIPESVTEIGVGAFYANASLTSVVIPEGVRALGYGVFSLCVGLKNISLPSTLETLNALAFAFCQKLSSVEIPEKISGISGYTFFRCTELSKVTFLGDIKYINQNAFADCKYLNNLTIPESVTSISDSAFSGCRRLVVFNVYPDSYGEAFCKKNYSSYEYTINVIRHEWTTVNVVAPTCASEGYTLEKCSLCGEQRKVDPVPPTEAHRYGSYTTVSYPDCDTPGRRERTCNVCGHVDVLETAPLGHTYDDWKVESTVSCSSDGVRTRGCFYCDYVDVEVTPALPHTYGEWEIIREPAWGVDGEQRRTCSSCGFVETQKISVHDHVYTPVVTPATCTKGGFTTYTCDCGASYLSDYTQPLAHSYSDWTVTQTPVCGIDGKRVRTCSACGDVQTEVIPADPHQYTAVVTPATCTDGGYTTYTCACGATYVSDYTQPLAHSYGDWTVTQAPTCESEGKRVRTCSACGDVQTEVIPADPHQYTAVVTPATCTDGGYTTYTCACGDEYVADYTTPLPHTYGEWTQTEPGTEVQTCSVCGHQASREVPIYGDVDGNRIVDENDLALLLSVLVGKTSGEGKATDLDSDGKLTIYDGVLLNQLLESME